MRMRTLLMISLIGGALAALIVAAARFLIRGMLSPHDIEAALLMGAASGMGLFFAFMKNLDRTKNKPTG